MARTGSTNTAPPAPEQEPVVDFMADAPAERPYSEAITPEHRQALAEHGIVVPEVG